MHHPTDRIIHTMAFAKPVVEHWLEREKNNEKTQLCRDTQNAHMERFFDLFNGDECMMSVTRLPTFYDEVLHILIPKLHLLDDGRVADLLPTLGHLHEGQQAHLAHVLVV